MVVHVDLFVPGQTYEQVVGAGAPRPLRLPREAASTHTQDDSLRGPPCCAGGYLERRRLSPVWCYTDGTVQQSLGSSEGEQIREEQCRRRSPADPVDMGNFSTFARGMPDRRCIGTAPGSQADSCSVEAASRMGFWDTPLQDTRIDRMSSLASAGDAPAGKCYHTQLEALAADSAGRMVPRTVPGEMVAGPEGTVGCSQLHDGDWGVPIPSGNPLEHRTLFPDDFQAMSHAESWNIRCLGPPHASMWAVQFPGRQGAEA